MLNVNPIITNQIAKHFNTITSERSDMVGFGMNINKVEGNSTPPSL